MTSLGEQTQSEQPRSNLFRLASSAQTEQVTMEEASTQTEQPTPDSPHPMFEKYPDNLDEACTNPKTLHSETNGNQWPDLLSQPNGDRHGARRRHFVNDSDDDEPPARCQRFDSPPPEYCPSPPPYRIPTLPLPEYESPIKGEEPVIELQPHLLLAPPETENQADRERAVNEQLRLERANRPVGQVEWEGEDGPQVLITVYYGTIIFRR